MKKLKLKTQNNNGIGFSVFHFFHFISFKFFSKNVENRINNIYHDIYLNYSDIYAVSLCN